MSASSEGKQKSKVGTDKKVWKFCNLAHPENIAVGVTTNNFLSKTTI